MTYASLQPCVRWEGVLPEYVEACLRDGSTTQAYLGLLRHLSRCARCAMLVAETIAVLRWREAEEPFDRRVLPLPPIPLCRDGVGEDYYA